MHSLLPTILYLRMRSLLPTILYLSMRSLLPTILYLRTHSLLPTILYFCACAKASTFAHSHFIVYCAILEELTPIVFDVEKDICACAMQ
jgi:hypothetical protein